jgi:hypothetical protein
VPIGSRGKKYFLRTERFKLLADDSFNLATNFETKRQPRKHSGCLTADVAGAHQKAVAGYLGIDRIFAERSDKKL